MHVQLQAVTDEFRSATDRLHRLASTVPEELWPRRPGPERWSVAECVAHLNLTSEAYLPLLRPALEEARSLGGTPPRRYRRGAVGWLLWRTMGPPVRVRAKTIAAFVPRSTSPPAELVREFERLQAEQIACVEQGDGLPLGAVRIASPFNQRVKYNLYACFGILARHQHRHLWQAEEAARALGAAG